MAGESILVVDDNPENLKLAKVLLLGEGYAVTTASDAEQALEILKSLRPRLILELTRRVKSDPARRDILILALTAYAMKGDDERVRAAGCDGYVAKPIDVLELPKTIARLLEKRPA